MREKKKKSIDPEELIEDIVSVDKAENVADNAQSYEVATEADAMDKTEEAAEQDIDALCAEIEALRAELEARKAENERIFAQIREFATVFPKRAVSSITDEVWDRVRDGVPLAAAYALYEKQREASENYAREVNERNASRSAGAISSSPESGYYSPSEVKSMTPGEVRKNYRLIIESMKKWN